MVSDKQGFKDIEGELYYESTKPFLTIPDIILWARYHGDADDTWPILSERFDISPIDYPLWDWMTKQRLSTLDVHTLHRRGLIDNVELFNHLAQIGWSPTDRVLMSELGWLVP
ncbi:unnamed protein product, partial [marine sediment metagenome]